MKLPPQRMSNGMSTPTQRPQRTIRGHTAKMIAVCLAFLAVCLILPGCRRGPPVVYVEGVVTMNGEPIEGANVGFTPVGKPGAMPAAGFTDARGKFVLSTHTAKFGGGATVGDYVVIVSKTIIPPGEEDKDSPKVVLVTPPLYQVKETSPLRATVKNGQNRFEFDLKSDSK
jgi:hypothetical protein